MVDEKRGLPNLTSRLVIPIALAVVAGIAQIAFAFYLLTVGKSANWFLTIMIAGMFVNIGIIVHSSIRRAREQATPIER